LLAETEITTLKADPARTENAMGPLPDNPRDRLPRYQEQTASAHGV
jgi:hypothetical protein